MKRLAILLSILASLAAVATLVQAYLGIWLHSGTFGRSAFLTFIVTVGLGTAAASTWIEAL